MTQIKFNSGFQQIFDANQLTLGVFFAIEAYKGSIPTMQNQVALARRAEELGFAALWVRDVPLYDPSFDDVGQIYDPWVYLGYIAAQTQTIALATGSIIFSRSRPADEVLEEIGQEVLPHVSDRRGVLSFSQWMMTKISDKRSPL